MKVLNYIEHNDIKSFINIDFNKILIKRNKNKENYCKYKNIRDIIDEIIDIGTYEMFEYIQEFVPNLYLYFKQHFNVAISENKIKYVKYYVENNIVNINEDIDYYTPNGIQERKEIFNYLIEHGLDI